jgi:hypothetical protein
MLMPNPPSEGELTRFFTALRDEYQIEQARLAFQQKKGVPE